MPHFNVSVQKAYYKTGFLCVEAENSEQAIAVVDSMIYGGQLQSSNGEEGGGKEQLIEWGDLTLEEGSFNTTGDVDEVK